MPDRLTVRLLVFPPSDTVLRHDVEEAVSHVPGFPSDVTAATVVEQRLRRVYRNVQIRPRDTLGGYDNDPTAVWYVYRDGRIRAKNEARERLYGVLAAARETVSSTERALQHSVTAAQRAGYRDVGEDAGRSADHAADDAPS